MHSLPRQGPPLPSPSPLPADQFYLWHTITDNDAGTALYTVDGVAHGTFSTTPLVPIATQNGTYNSVAAERIFGIVPGTHTVVITDISGDLAVLGLGTPPPQLSSNSPMVLAGSVPLPDLNSGAYLLSSMNAYTADTAALVTLLVGDGLDVRYAPNHSFMTGSDAEMTDVVHVSPLGAMHLAEAFLAVGP